MTATKIIGFHVTENGDDLCGNINTQGYLNIEIFSRTVSISTIL